MSSSRAALQSPTRPTRMRDDYAPSVLVVPIRTPEDRAAVAAAAKFDNHSCLCATHYVVKTGQIVGYFNVGHSVHWWMHSKQCNRDDSRQVLCVLEAMQLQNGWNAYAIFCAEDSPYRKVMDQFGFQDWGATRMFVKELKHGLL